MAELLLLEDDCDTREALTEALTMSGHNVTAFRTGIHALEWLAGNKPDLVVLDSALPWVEGDEVLKRMRGSKRLAAVPAIVISADIKRIARARTLTPYVLPKPFEPSVLIDMIDSILGNAARSDFGLAEPIPA